MLASSLVVVVVVFVRIFRMGDVMVKTCAVCWYDNVCFSQEFVTEADFRKDCIK